MSMRTLLLLLLLALPLSGCPSSDDDDSATDDDDTTGDDDDTTGDDDDTTGDDDDTTGDDDDSTGDDDDSAGDDDDSVGDDDDTVGDDDDSAGDDDDSVGDDDDTVGDDDDSVGDDDDSAGDDDDSAGDDDDSAGDDDDSAAVEPAWVGDIYCLDWSSVTWVTPDATTIALANAVGLDLTSVPMLMSPLSIVGTDADQRITGGAGNCTQDLAIDTLDTLGTWNDPDIGFGPVNMSVPLSTGTYTIYDVTMTGEMDVTGAQITDSDLSGLLDLGGASSACAVLTCVPCPVTGTATCVELQAEDADWNNVGAGPLVYVP